MLEVEWVGWKDVLLGARWVEMMEDVLVAR